MRRRRIRHSLSPQASTGIVGIARVGDRTKDLVKRMSIGEIAVIDHRDLDRVAAESLIAAGVGAVVNASPSISGRYPNGGPIRIVMAGIPLIDLSVHDDFARFRDGEELRIDGAELWHGDTMVAEGLQLDRESIDIAMEEARSAIGVELERFAENTLAYIRRESHSTFGPVELPPLRTTFKGRHALVVVRGHDYKRDLRTLRPYIKEYRPVLIGVDGGADALLELGFAPDIIIGDFDSVSEEAVFRVGAQLIHHVHVDGRGPGREQLQEWKVQYDEFVVDGMSEDAAMLLAYEAGAELVVAVGTHATMVEFLDKGRRGMSSTFLTRLRLGPVLVDAKGVGRLYDGRVHRRDMLLLVASAMAAMVAIGVVSEPIHTYLDGIRFTFDDLWSSIRNAL